MIPAGVCAPAMIYFVFSLVQIIIDVGTSMYNTALLKLIVAFIITLLLNLLCQRGLGIVSWLIVFIPFMLTSVIITILLFVFGLKPSAGKITVNYPKDKGTSLATGIGADLHKAGSSLDADLHNAGSSLDADLHKLGSSIKSDVTGTTKTATSSPATQSTAKTCPNGCVPPLSSDKSCQDVVVSGKKQHLCPYECIGGVDSGCKGNNQLCSQCGQVLVPTSVTHDVASSGAN